MFRFDSRGKLIAHILERGIMFNLPKNGSEKIESQMLSFESTYKGTLLGLPPESYVAGDYVTFSILYMAPIEGINDGDFIRLYSSRQVLGYDVKDNFPQVDDPKQNAFISGERSDEGGVKLNITGKKADGVGSRELEIPIGTITLEIRILDKPLLYGEYVRITFGDKSKGADKGYPLPAYIYPRTGSLIWAFAEVETASQKQIVRAERPVEFPILAGKACSFLVNSDSEYQVNEEIIYQIIPVDKHRNPASFAGAIDYQFTLNEDRTVSTGTEELFISPYQKHFLRYTPQEIGVLRLKIESKGVAGIGFPVKITNRRPTEKRFWGDMHVHTFCSDGYGLPDEATHYSKEILGHQFIALGDHDVILRDIDSCIIDKGNGIREDFSGFNRWPAYIKALQNYNSPDVFTTILGHEISTKRPNSIGHRNMYVGTDDHFPYSDPIDGVKEAIFKIARRCNALIIPHHSVIGGREENGMGTDWNYHDEEVERLVEIYSCFGSSEEAGSFEVAGNPDESQSVISALNRGYHLGFVAGTDAHSGRASNVSLYEGEKVGCMTVSRRGGTTCVIAERNTREAIFSALWNRHCYAVTGENRMLLEFYINDHPMGSIVARSEDPRRIRFSVSAMDNILLVTVIKNGKELRSYHPDALDFAVTLVDEKAERVEDYYYLRVMTTCKDRAWSSPIWC